MAIKYLRTSLIKNKTALVRGSVDAPVDKVTGKIADDFRLQSLLPTIRFLTARGNKVIICGKMGRAGGRPAKNLSLKPAAEHLASLLGYKFIETDYKIPEYGIRHLIFYTGDFRKEKHQEQLSTLPDKDIVFLENLEFYSEELENDAFFGKMLVSFADVYVDDDFSKCHHAVASNVAVAKYAPSYAGLLLEKEIKSLESVLKHSQQPFVLMMGGIKISDKVKTIENLGKKTDKILLAGGLANLFFLSKGYEIGLSKVEKEASKIAWALERNFKDKIILPLDVVVADEKMDKNTIRVTEPHQVGKKEIIYDIGPKTILAYANALKTAKTIVWNGPLGLFEERPFHTGTMALARIIGGVASRKAFAVVGGGETVDAVRQAHQLEHIDHVSTGGGAMLEYLAGKKLPGIEALK